MRRRILPVFLLRLHPTLVVASLIGTGVRRIVGAGVTLVGHAQSGLLVGLTRSATIVVIRAGIGIRTALRYAGAARAASYTASEDTNEPEH